MQPYSFDALGPEGVDPDVLRAKLEDLETPGLEVAFDPDEADALGAFQEDALSDEDALEAASDKDWEVAHG
jgi:hypothetical protein